MARKALDYTFASTYDTRRAPAWRYERVQRLLASSNPPHPRRDDQLTKELRQYYITKRRYRNVLEDDHELQNVLGAKFGPIWIADRIFFGGRSDRARYGVEAMLLAGESDEAIAEANGATPAAINLYEQLFFNVRDRLSNYNYIASIVLMDAFMSGLGNRTPEMTAKYFGYFGGPVILRVILDGFDAAVPRPTEPTEVLPWFDGVYRRFTRVITNIGLGFMEPTNFNIRTLVEGYQSLLSLDHREATSRGEDNPIRQALSVFINRFPLPRGDAADKLPHRPGITYAGGHVEPRVSELNSLQSGHDVVSLKKYSDDWKPAE
jgi:hypothetical protein